MSHSDLIALYAVLRMGKMGLRIHVVPPDRIQGFDVLLLSLYALLLNVVFESRGVCAR